MALPTSDPGGAINFYLIPGFTSQWPSGLGTIAPFNTQGTGSFPGGGPGIGLINSTDV